MLQSRNCSAAAAFVGSSFLLQMKYDKRFVLIARLLCVTKLAVVLSTNAGLQF